MAGEVEYGKCDVCGKHGHIERTYFNYPIPCECHSPQHFEIVYHHFGCTPVEPPYTKIHVRTKSNWMRGQGKWHRHVNWVAVIAWSVIGIIASGLILMGLSIISNMMEKL